MCNLGRAKADLTAPKTFQGNASFAAHNHHQCRSNCDPAEADLDAPKTFQDKVDEREKLRLIRLFFYGVCGYRERGRAGREWRRLWVLNVAGAQPHSDKQALGQALTCKLRVLPSCLLRLLSTPHASFPLALHPHFCLQ